MRDEKLIESKLQKIKRSQYPEILSIVEHLKEENTKVSPEGYSKLLTRLISCFEKHFDSEEAFMEKINFPGIDLHITGHKKFMNKIYLIQQSFKRGEPANAEQLCTLVVDWLFDHEMGRDIEYLIYAVQNIRG